MNYTRHQYNRENYSDQARKLFNKLNLCKEDKKFFKAYETLEHDGYEYDGPKSNIWTLYIYDINKRSINIYVRDYWFQGEDIQEYKLEESCLSVEKLKKIGNRFGYCSFGIDDFQALPLDEQTKTEHFEDGKKIREEWHFSSVLHREDGPAEILYFENGNICGERWYQDGKQHKLDGPAEIEYFENGNKSIEIWCQNNEIHRLDGPAVIRYFENGNIREAAWCKNGKQHRVDDPACIRYCDDGDKRAEAWYQNGKIHRVDGPAKIHYYENGNIKQEWWYQNDRLHRVDGPAKIRYNNDGNILEKRWSLNGRFLSKNNFYKVLDILKRSIKVFREKKREMIFSQLKNSESNFYKINGSDICRYLARFVY